MRKIRIIISLAGCCWWLITGCAASRKEGKSTGGPGIDIPAPGADTFRSPARQAMADSLFMEAESAGIQGNTRKAITTFNDYLKIDRNNPTVYYELAGLFKKLQNPAAAVAFSRKALQLDPGNRWFGEAYANALAANQQTDSAAAVFGRLYKTYPRQEEYLYNQSVLLSGAGHYEEALSGFKALENSMGINEELVYEIQRIYLKLNRVEDAAAEIRKLIAQNPRESRYFQLLAEVYYTHNMPDKAFGVYQELLSENPGNPQALIAIALHYKRQGNEQEYEQYMEKAFANPDLSIEDKIDFVRPFLKYTEVDSTKGGEGLMLCRMILTAHPKDARAYALYGDMLLQCHEPDSALAQYRHALSIDDSKYEVWQQVMFVEAAGRQNDSLLRVSEEVIKKFPGRFAGWYFNGSVNILLKRYEAGIRSLNTALETGIDDTDTKSHIYATLGEAYHATGEYAVSDSCFDLALLLKPDDDITLNNYSYYLSLRNTRLNKAEQMSKMALGLSPGNYVYEDTYAWILFKMGKYEEARQWMEKALQNSTAMDSPGYLEHYGDILYMLKDVSGALKYWELARQKGGNSALLDKKITLRKWVE